MLICGKCAHWYHLFWYSLGSLQGKNAHNLEYLWGSIMLLIEFGTMIISWLKWTKVAFLIVINVYICQVVMSAVAKFIKRFRRWTNKNDATQKLKD